MFYKVKDGNKVISLGKGNTLPSNAVEISEEDYNNTIAFIRENAKEGMMMIELEGGSYQYVADPSYQPSPDGSYLHPYPWSADTDLEVGAYYEQDGLILRCEQAKPTIEFGQAPYFEQL